MLPFDSEKLLDDVGWRILVLLQDNARLSFSEIGRQVGLTAPAVAERVRRLEENGIITGYHALVDAEKVGRGVSAFIRLAANDGRYAPAEAFARQQPQITECYCLTGDTDLLFKVACASLRDLDALVNQLADFGSVSTSVILATYLPRRTLE